MSDERRGTADRLSFPNMDIRVDPAQQGEDEPECVICGNLGEYYDADHKLVVCMDCPHGLVILHRRYRSRFANAGVPDDYQHLNFEHFDALGPQSGKVIALEAMRQAAAAPGQPFALAPIYERYGVNPPDASAHRRHIVLYGEYGTGKTALAAALANDHFARADGLPVVFMTARDVVAAVQDTYSTGEARMSVLAAFREAPILCIDEMAPNVVDTEDRRTLWYDILRYRMPRSRLTILTTNFDEASMRQAWGHQIAEEMERAAHWIRVGGNNLRNRKQLKPEDFF